MKKLIVFTLTLFLCVFLFWFGNGSTVFAASGTIATYHLLPTDTQVAGTTNFNDSCSEWGTFKQASGKSKFSINDFYDQFQLIFNSDSSSVELQYHYLGGFNSNYEIGSDSYYKEFDVGTGVYNSTKNSYSPYYQETHNDKTGKPYQEGWKFILSIKNQSGSETSKYYTSTDKLSGFNFDSTGTIQFQITFSIRYTDGYSYEGDEYTYTYYSFTTNWIEVMLSDVTAPEIGGVEEGQYYNHSVTLNFNDNVGINRIFYSCGQKKYTDSQTTEISPNSSYFNFTASGWYTVTVIDSSGNSSTIKFIIDVTAPEIGGVEEGQYYNHSVTLNLSDSTTAISKVLVNGVSKDFGDNQLKLSPSDYSGLVTVTCYDQLNNSTTRTFYFDTILPQFNISTDGYYNHSVTISWNDSISYGVSGTVQKAVYSRGQNEYSQTVTTPISNNTTFSEEGYYIITITDRAGNSSTIKFIIDLTPPEIGGVEEGQYYNRSVTLNFNDNCKKINRILVNGVPKDFEDNQLKLSPSDYSGQVQVICYDEAGNSSTRTFYFDTNSPSMSFSEYNLLLKNKYYTSNAITIMANESCDWIIADKHYYDTTTLILSVDNINNGEYTLTCTDRAGNSSTATIVFDTNQPTISFSNAQMADGIYYSKSIVTATFNSLLSPITQIYYYMSDSKTEIDCQTENKSFQQEGKYEITIVNAAGNSLTYTLVIDKSLPTISVFSNGNQLSNNSSTNNTISVSFNDNFKLSYYCTLNFNDSFQSIETNISHSFTENGTYLFTLTDVAGNESKFKIIIERDAPEIGGVEEGQYYNRSVTLNFSDSTTAISKVVVNGVPKDFGDNQLTFSVSEYYGQVQVICYDQAGNSSTRTFYLDNRLPTTNIENNHFYNFNILIEISDLAISNQSYLQLEETIKYLPGGVENQILTWIDGTYTLYLVDQAGNSTTYTFTIDTVPPEGSLSGYYQLIDDIYYGNNSSIINFVFDSTEAKAKFNNQEYTGGSIRIVGSELNDGLYNIELIDKAGNTTSYCINIKSTLPEATIEGYYQFYNGIYYANNSSSLLISWKDDTLTASFNDQEYRGSSFTILAALIEEKEYTITLADKYGNSTTYTLVVDKTADYNNYNFLSSSNYNRVIQYYNTCDYNYSHMNFTEGVTYSFASKEQALAFARQREFKTVESIVYTHQSFFYTNLYGTISEYYDYEYLSNIKDGDTVYAYKSLSSPNKIVIYFNYSNLYKATEHYVNASVSEYYRFFDSEENLAKAYNEDVLYDKFYINSTTYTLSKAESSTSIWVSTNGNDYIMQTSKAFLNSKTNYIREIDQAGNILEYIVLLNISPIEYMVYTNDSLNSVFTNQLKQEKEIYSSKAIQLLLSSNHEHYVIKTTFTDLIGSSQTSYSIDINLELTLEGKYVIDTYDVFGNKSDTYTIYILYSKPEISTTINKVDDIIIDLKIAVDYVNLIKNQITNILILFTDEEGQKSYLTKDSKGIEINTSNKSWTFDISGEYTITLTDIFGNSASKTEKLQKGKPFGQLFVGSPATAVSSGTITNQSIYFSWNTQYEYTCTCNGARYTSGTAIAAEGTYTFSLSNADQISTYIITIDKTAPKIVLKDGEDILSSGITTASKNVKLEALEENLTITLNGNNYISGTVLTKEGINIFRITDRAGNVLEIEITIDWTAPKVTIWCDRKQIASGSIVNSTIRFEWSESKCTATLNGIMYSSGQKQSLPGTYSLTITDTYGNTAIYTVTIDKSQPEFEIHTEDTLLISSSSKINQGFYVTWVDDYQVYINDVMYTKNSVITAAGTYVIKVINAAGTVVESSISISYTIPVGELYNNRDSLLKSGVLTNQNVYFTWTDEKDNRYTATLNDTPYTKGLLIKTDGEYTITLTDTYGNTSTYAFTIDKTAPVGELVGVEDGGYTNTPVYFTWSEENCTATLNGGNYTSNIKILFENTYTIILTDQAGNSTTYTFTIDKTAPEFSFSEPLNEYNYASKRLSISWKEKNCVATLNAKPYTSGTLISDGSWEFTLTDQAGNSSKIQFTITRDAPSIKIAGVNKYNKSSTSVTLEWESDLIVLVNGSSTQSGAVFTKDGIYYVIATNLAGIQSIYTFEISTVPPVGELVGVEDGGFTNRPVSFTWSEENCSATLNNYSYSKNTTITKQGKYIITLTNSFGSTSTYAFTIDKTAPVGELVGVEDGGYTNKPVSFTWSEENCSAYLNNEKYISGTTIKNDGEYTLVLTDQAGNTSTYTFTIDTVPPVGELVGVEDGGFTNKTVSFSWAEENCSAYLNNKPYTANEKITQEGFYTLVLTDKYGNSTTYTFTIDKTAPEFKILDQNDKLIEINSTINIGFYVQVIESLATIMMNEAIYEGEIITDEGEYVFVISDYLGNMVQFVINIDYNAPIAILVGVEDGGITNKNVTIDFNSSCTATLNAKPYTANRRITEEGFYTLVLTNPIGNTSTYTFTIDKTAPVGELVGVEDGGYTNTPVYFTWSEENCKVTLDNEEYVSERVTEEGYHIITIADRAGNSTTYAFTIDKTAPVGELVGVEDGGYTNTPVYFTWSEENCTATLNGKSYIKKSLIRETNSYTLVLTDQAGNTSIYLFEISTIPPVGELVGVEDGGITNKTVKIYFKNCTATLNDQVYLSDDITSEGFYTLVLTDKYGNSTTYTFTIDKTAPVGELTGVEDGGFTNTPVYFTWKEKNCTAYLNNEKYASVTTIKNDGEYTLVLTDQAGNTSTYTFTIDTMPPVGELIGISGEDNHTNQNVYFTWSEENCTATLNGESYEKEQLIIDENLYVIVLTDKYGNTSTYTFTIDKTAPVGELVGVENGGFTNQTVSFVSTEKNLKIYVNDELFSDTYITRSNNVNFNGLYKVVIVDQAGNRLELSFEYYYISEESCRDSLIVNLSSDKSAATLNVSNSSFDLYVDEEKKDSGYELSTPGTYMVQIKDKFGNNYSLEIKILAKHIPNYMINNIATIALISLVSIGVIVLLVKKLKSNKNPYASK